jgi:hypothetical protein
MTGALLTHTLNLEMRLMFNTRMTVTLIAVGLACAGRISAQTFELAWKTIDCGGTIFNRVGAYSLGGTIGQPDAGSFAAPLSGGGFELVGGFWPVAEGPQSPPCTGDLNGDGVVSLADLTAQLSHFGTLSGATLADGDLDGDGDVDLSDLTTLLSNFGTACP